MIFSITSAWSYLVHLWTQSYPSKFFVSPMRTVTYLSSYLIFLSYSKPLFCIPTQVKYPGKKIYKLPFDISGQYALWLKYEVWEKTTRERILLKLISGANLKTSDLDHWIMDKQPDRWLMLLIDPPAGAMPLSLLRESLAAAPLPSAACAGVATRGVYWCWFFRGKILPLHDA